MIAYTFRQIKTSILLLIIIMIITGMIYPICVTGIAQLFFPFTANGSLILRDGKPIGSHLIGQSFTDVKYFWGRPSSTTPYAYNALYSTGSNLAATNPLLLSKVRERIRNLQLASPSNQKLIPVDLVTASASGLDPDISPLSAYYQVGRIAKARGKKESEIYSLIQEFVKKSPCNVLGEPRVNVLSLNMALDSLH